ncbi:MAG: tRNA (guanosine(46)-N(7))-methyltransferase TrmB [Hyphomicrobiaceae bacterium]
MSDAPDPEHTSELRSFGRRRGRKPSTRQAQLLAERLPELSIPLTREAPRPLARLFEHGAVADVWLEIGFGGGEHLVHQARSHADVGLIGSEPFEDGVIKVLSDVEAHGITNIRLHADDARPLLRWLPEGSLGRVFILFPDPWPKRRHAKRRLVAPATLALIVRAVRIGGELRVATDIGAYARSTLLAVAATPGLVWTARGPADWRQRPPDAIATRYEAKALAAGRTCTYLRFRRIAV